MDIACLGWGSLIWDKRLLPLKPSSPPRWHSDGPELPIEFARESSGERITLVAVTLNAAKPIPVLWAYMNCSAIDDAHEALARREWGEGPPPRDWIRWKNRNIAKWTNMAGGTPTSETPQIAAWANGKRLDGVVWTILAPKINGEERVPTIDEIVSALERLQKSNRHARAEEYVRKAPPKIETRYRKAIEDKFGWACFSSATLAEII